MSEASPVSIPATSSSGARGAGEHGGTTFQLWAALFIVGACALLLFRHWARAWRRLFSERGGACGGCGGCAVAEDAKRSVASGPVPVEMVRFDRRRG